MYRASRFCPACQHSAMRPIRVQHQDEHSEVELCESCGGFYIEFFDGDLSSLACALLPFLVKEQPLRPRAAELQCPDCRIVLVETPYLSQGVPIRRCPGCLCAFVSPAEVVALAEIAIDA